MERAQKLNRTLGMWSLVMLGLGYLTPAVVFDTFAMTLRDTKGHVPTAYLLTLLGMIFTAFSYGKMVKLYPSAGSSYTYASKTINPSVGFMVGWASLLDYLLLPMINVLLAQQYLSAIFPEIPPWIWVFLISGLVTFVNIKGIESTASLNSLFVYYQFAMVIVFIIFCLKFLFFSKTSLHLGASTFPALSLAPFYDSTFELKPILMGATILCFSFLGFDAVSNYAEESINPRRDVPKAIILTALLGGGIFIICSYLAQLVFPDYAFFKDIANSSAAEISFFLGGRFFQVLFLAASLVGVIASGLASHASVSRLLYVMGRDKVLPPSFFGKLSDKYQVPLYNVLFVGIFCITALFFTVENAVHAISFGSLIAFSFVNISVLSHFCFKNKKFKKPKDFLLNFLMPCLGLFVIFILWLNVKSLAFIFGSCWFIVGLVYLIFLKRVKKLDLSSIRLE